MSKILLEESELEIIINYKTLPAFIRSDIEEFQETNQLHLKIDENGYCNIRPALNYWLQWNGIVGYTDNIITFINCIIIDKKDN
jgi:hypothetical protein